MVEKIIKFVIILIFAALGVFLMEIATPLLGEFVSSDTLKLGFLGVTPLNLIMGIIGALIFGYIGKAAATPLIHYTLHYSEILASYLADLPTGDIFVLSIGVITGLIVATLLGTAFSRLPIVGPYISLIFSIMGAIIGAKVALNKREDILYSSIESGLPGTRTIPGKPMLGMLPALINCWIPAFSSTAASWM